MLPGQVRDALSRLSASLPELERAVRTRWQAGSREGANRRSLAPLVDLPDDLRAAADLLGSSLP